MPITIAGLGVPRELCSKTVAPFGNFRSSDGMRAAGVSVTQLGLQVIARKDFTILREGPRRLQ